MYTHGGTYHENTLENDVMELRRALAELKNNISIS